MTSTGFLDINGNDLITLYVGVSDNTFDGSLNFTGSNVFNGTIYHKITISSTTASYDITTVPNFVLAKGNNQPMNFTLPTTGVLDGFILNFRRNSGTGNVTYNFNPAIYNSINTSITTFSSNCYSFSLIKYGSSWYIHSPLV